MANLKRITVEFDDGSPPMELVPVDTEVLDSEVSLSRPPVEGIKPETNVGTLRSGPVSYVKIFAVLRHRQ